MSSSQAPLLPDATRELARFAAETRAGDLPARVIDRVTRDLVGTAERTRFRIGVLADGHGVVAARMEAATGGRVGEVRRTSGNARPEVPRPVNVRHASDQAVRVWVERPVVQKYCGNWPA